MQKQVHGGDIYSRPYHIDFSANINPFGMPERVKAAAMEGVSQSIHYPDVTCRKLREKIALKEQIPMDWLLCTNGAAELLFALTQTLKPQKALLTAPGFAEYEQALKACGGEICFYPCKKENGFALSEDYLLLLNNDIDIIFLCNPNNPTGLTIQKELLNKILNICMEQQIFVVLDECFLEFLNEELQNPQKDRLGQMHGLLILKAFTKMYGMPGLRLGYGMCSDTELMKRVKEVLQPWNVSLPAQLAGEAALEEKEFVRKTVAFVEAERTFISDGLKTLGFVVYDSKANYLFFEGPEDLYEVCASEGILIRDCSNYRGLSNGYFRIAIKTREENEELLKLLKKHYG